MKKPPRVAAGKDHEAYLGADGVVEHPRHQSEPGRSAHGETGVMVDPKREGYFQ